MQFLVVPPVPTHMKTMTGVVFQNFAIDPMHLKGLTLTSMLKFDLNVPRFHLF